MPAAIAIVGMVEVGGAVAAAGGFTALMAGEAAFTLTSGLAAVGGLATTLGAVTGDKDLIKMGAVASLASGVSGIADSLASSSGDMLDMGDKLAMPPDQTAGLDSVTGVDTSGAMDAPKITGDVQAAQSDILSSGNVTGVPTANSGVADLGQNMNTPGGGLLNAPSTLPNAAATPSASGAPSAAHQAVAPGAPSAAGAEAAAKAAASKAAAEKANASGWLDTLLKKMDNKGIVAAMQIGGSMINGAFPTDLQKAQAANFNANANLTNSQMDNMAGLNRLRATPGILYGAAK